MTIPKWIRRFLVLTLSFLVYGFFHPPEAAAQAEIIRTDVRTFALSNQQDRLAIATNDGTIEVIDIATYETLLELTDEHVTSPVARAWPSPSVTWSANDERILTVHDSEIAVWDATTGALVFELEPELLHPVSDDMEPNLAGKYSAAISPDGSVVAVGNWNDAVVIYTLEISRELLHQNRAGLYGPIDMAFSPSGELLATRSFSGDIAIWEVATGEKKHTLFGETVEFNSDGSLLATSGGRWSSGVWIWDMASGDLLMETAAPLMTTQIAWTTDDSILFGLFDDRQLVNDGFAYVGQAIRGWNTTTGVEESTLGFTQPYSLELALDEGEILIWVGIAHAEGYVFIWKRDPNNVYEDVYGKELSPDTPPQDYQLLSVPMNDFALSPDGDTVFAALDTGIVAWDAQSGDLLDQVSIGAWVLNIEYAAAHNAVVSITFNSLLIIWHPTE